MVFLISHSLCISGEGRLKFTKRLVRSLLGGESNSLGGRSSLRGGRSTLREGLPMEVNFQQVFFWGAVDTVLDYAGASPQAGPTSY